MIRRAWIALLLAGCVTARPAAPPGEALPVIAVEAGDEFGALLVSELSKTGRCRAVRVAEGRRTRADSILSVTIKEFDRYEPPRVALWVRVQRGPGTEAGDLDRLSQSGSWGRVGRPADVSSFDLVLDARDLETREALRAFARTQDGDASAFTEDREFLAVSSSYLRFAASQVAARVSHDRR